MAFNPDNSSINNDCGQGGGFKIGSDRQFGKIDAQIGMSSGFGDKSRVKNSLDSLYAQGRQRRIMKMAENCASKAVPVADAGKNTKPENGLLEYNDSASANSAIRKTVDIMNKNNTFGIFGAKTSEAKRRVAEIIINEIEGGNVGDGSYVHKGKANSMAREILNKGVKGIGGLNVKNDYTGMQAKKAVAGAIGELTRNKEIMRRAGNN